MQRLAPLGVMTVPHSAQSTACCEANELGTYSIVDMMGDVEDDDDDDDVLTNLIPTFNYSDEHSLPLSLHSPLSQSL